MEAYTGYHTQVSLKNLHSVKTNICLLVKYLFDRALQSTEADLHNPARSILPMNQRAPGQLSFRLYINIMCHQKDMILRHKYEWTMGWNGGFQTYARAVVPLFVSNNKVKVGAESARYW
jgi:hypothetical protein